MYIYIFGNKSAFLFSMSILFILQKKYPSFDTKLPAETEPSR